MNVITTLGPTLRQRCHQRCDIVATMLEHYLSANVMSYVSSCLRLGRRERKGAPQDYEKAVYYFSLGAANSFAERQGR